MKRFLRIISYFLLVLLLCLAGAGFWLFKNQEVIIKQFVATSNRYLKAEVNVESIQLDFWHTFPNIAIEVKNPVIKDAIEGSTDTLLKAQNLYLALDIVSLINKDVTIKEIVVDQGFIHLKVDEYGRNNYTIFKKDTAKTSDQGTIELSRVQLNNFDVQYIDLRIANNHKIFSKNLEAKIELGDTLNFDINGDAFVDHITIHDSPYIQEKEVSLNTQLQFVPNEGLLTIVPSDLMISGVAFTLGGKYQKKDNSYLSLSVDAKEANIKSLVSLLPNSIAKSVGSYQSEGRVYFNGKIEGRVDPGHNPKIDFKFGFRNASFFLPNNKSRFDNANMVGTFSNGSERTSRTSYVILDSISTDIKGQRITGKFAYRDFKHPRIEAALKGDIYLRDLKNTLPDSLIDEAAGVVQVNVTIKGLLSEIEDPKSVSSLKSEGTAVLKNVYLKMNGQKLAFSDLNGKLQSNLNNLRFDDVSGKWGNSSFHLKGQINNFFSLLFSENKQFSLTADVSSDFLDLDEVLSADSKDVSKTAAKNDDYALGLPKNITLNLKTHIKEVKFRRFYAENSIRDVSGIITLKDRFLSFKELSLKMADGEIALNGALDARNDQQPILEARGDLFDTDVQKGFYLFENFNQTFITDKHLKGRLTADFYVYLPFDEKLKVKPDKLTSIIHATIDNGELNDFNPMVDLGQFIRQKNYDKYTKSNNFSNIRFSKLENTISIHNQTVEIPEMKITSSVADFNISGTHTYSGDMDYYISFPLINYKRRAGDVISGVGQSEETKEFFIYLQIVGNSDNYEVILDKKKSLKTAKEKVIQELKETIQQDEEDPYIQIDTQDTTDAIDFDDL